MLQIEYKNSYVTGTCAGGRLCSFLSLSGSFYCRPLPRSLSLFLARCKIGSDLACNAASRCLCIDQRCALPEIEWQPLGCGVFNIKLFGNMPTVRARRRSLPHARFLCARVSCVRAFLVSAWPHRPAPPSCAIATQGSDTPANKLLE